MAPGNSHEEELSAAVAELSCPIACAGRLDVTNATVCCTPPSDLLVNFPATDEQLQALSAVCSTATFGQGQKAVLDPTYRKALALATNKFFTSFHLEDHDILPTIKATLMPDAASVTAQLYKLNVYGPGDFFKAHVDTPRGDGMFGSLVVCLPQPHTGGALLVRHKGQEQRFDFAIASAAVVQWAALYADCEHEILPVESGHRVTLTFNLYCTKSDEIIGPHMPSLSNESLALYKELAAAISSSIFFPYGGSIAFPCEHMYPHTHDTLYKDVHKMLKGQDALCFKVLQHLGLQPRVEAVVDFTELIRSADENEDLEEGHDLADDDAGGEDGEDGVDVRNLRLQQLQKVQKINFSLGDGGDVYDLDAFHKTRPARRVMWVSHFLQYALQMVTAHYGNDPSTTSVYSAAAVFGDIPAWGSEERTQLVQLLNAAAAAQAAA